jgi:hypothetical protein
MGEPWGTNRTERGAGMVMGSGKVLMKKEVFEQMGCANGLNFRRFMRIEKVANLQIFVALNATNGRFFGVLLGNGIDDALMLGQGERLGARGAGDGVVVHAGTAKQGFNDGRKNWVATGPSNFPLKRPIAPVPRHAG